MKYYIKNNLIFSDAISKIKILDKIDEIKIPTGNKNHLIDNKILITDLDKLLNNSGRNFEISKPIENFEEIEKKINENKSKLKKVTSDNYEFIEKTSAIDIIKSILTTVENSNLNHLELEVKEYIQKNKQKELEKNTQLEESIDLEKSRIKEFEKKKEKILETSKVKQLEKLELQKEKINDEIKKNENLIEAQNNLSKNKSKTLNDKIKEIDEQQENLKFEIKISKNTIKSLKASLKLGKTKKFNWITGILMVFTLGLIYWTKYTDTKYFILKSQEKIAKYEEKITKLEQEKFNLKKKIINENKKEDSKTLEKKEKEKNLLKSNDDLFLKIEDIENKIKDIKAEIKKEDEKIESYDKEIAKQENKILDLETTRNEFEKYSTKKIKEKLDNLLNLKEKKFEELTKIKDKIKSQKTQIKGEFIIEL